MNEKEKLNNLIEDSALSDFDKKVWSIFIKTLTSEQIIPILEFIAEDSFDNLKIINKNLKQKIALANKKNSKNTQEIIDEEIKLIEEKMAKEEEA
ncbi:MAG: hypothetical protein COX29_02665 [Candidatus Moranbacteria bacterium CG23_combo_of_CG06-09_8_20_14_all_35_22]|nr:MAG: hypothetical protein COX29_02665 [Candidatus Moranbacteria bacterium CG23_combo_of_CG06-09_8_20_14_all_35_22]